MPEITDAEIALKDGREPAKITDYALARWERTALAIDDRWQSQAILRLIAAYRESQAEVERLRTELKAKSRLAG